MNSSDAIIRQILSDIRVELASEFDRNFERQSFFSRAWQRHKSPHKGNAHILVQTGTLRRSIKSRSDATSVTFHSDLPYSSIHNEGGKIKVTARMKRYFWARYYETAGRFTRRKDGSLSRSKSQTTLSSMAEFYKHMALMKVGSYVTIPKRQFIGRSPELEKEVTAIIEKNLQEYFEENAEKIIKKYDK